MANHLAWVLVLPLALIGCSEKEEAKAPPVDVAAGKVVAQSQCAACHGLDGKGAAPGIPNMAAQVQEYLVQSLHAYKDGKRTHAALRDMTAEMTDADIRNVAGYYAGLPPLAAPAVLPPEVVSPYDKGKAAAAICAECHGEAGNSTTPGIPSLAGQQPFYFVAAVRAYLDGRRPLSTMEMLRDLDRVELESVALYYAAETPARRGPAAFGDAVAGEPLSARCGGCHGAHGVSHDSMTPSLAGQDPDYLVSAIKAYRNRTRTHELMFDDNTDQEIENLAAFYAVQESKAAEHKAITVQELADKCDHCHGPDVQNPAMTIPKISGQDRDYLIRALRAYRDGKRGSSLMHNMSLPYSEAIMKSVASHYASQPPR